MPLLSLMPLRARETTWVSSAPKRIIELKLIPMRSTANETGPHSHLMPVREEPHRPEERSGRGAAGQTRGARLRVMNARTRKVLEEALELPSAERGELARELLESLQDTAPPDVESAWAAVITRRAQEVLDGTAATRDLDEGLDEVEARARARAAAR